MKKYIITHDTALFEESTIPSQNGLVASFKGIGKGAYVYGNLVSKYFFGVGNQNFIAITNPKYFNGLYVPVNVVKEVLSGISDNASQAKSSAEGEYGNFSGADIKAKIGGASTIVTSIAFGGVGFMLGTLIGENKISLTIGGIALGGLIGYASSKFSPDDKMGADGYSNLVSGGRNQRMCCHHYNVKNQCTDWRPC